MFYEIKSDDRTYQFNGVILAESSSKSSYSKDRWVEFTIYKTPKGQYVVSRIGMSVVYHVSGCESIEHHSLYESDRSTLSTSSVPCTKCNAGKSKATEVYPEVDRSYVMECSDPQGVIEFLHKKDKNGVKYLTNVAKDALEDASDVDDEFSKAYYTRYIE